MKSCASSQKIIEYFLKNSDLLEFGLCITAPTHTAVGVIDEVLRKNNIRVYSRTIHSFLGIRQFRDYKTGEEKFKIDRSIKDKPVRTLLIVDECSMVSKQLYKYIIEAVIERRVNTVLFIGDKYQLLPVGEMKTEIFGIKNRFELKKVVRQAKGSYIIDIATKLRERIEKREFEDLGYFFAKNSSNIEIFENKRALIEDFCKNKEWHKENKILATYTNISVDGFNKEFRERFWRQRGVYNPPAFLEGDLIRFKDAYIVDDVTLYYNSQEIVIKEAVKKYHDSLEVEYWECKPEYIIEDSLFRVIEPKSKAVFNTKLDVLAKMAKNEKNYEERKKLWGLFYKVKDMFANIQYIFSSTIHKLQGSTYSTVYIDLNSLINNSKIDMEEKYRLSYVAVTRASKDIKLLFAKRKNISYGNDMHIDLQKRYQNIDSVLSELL